MKKLISMIMVLAVMLTVLSGCSDEGDFDETVITVEGEEVSVAEALFHYYSVKLSYESSYGEGVMLTDMGDGTILADTAKGEAIEEALKINLCAYIAKERGITLDEEAIATTKENATTIFEGFDQESIDYYGFTLEGLEEVLIDYAYITELYDQVSAEVTLDEDQLAVDMELFAAQDTYLASLLDYGVEEALTQLRVRHILISTIDENSLPLSDEEIEAARVEAEDLLVRVQDGEDFATLVTEYSDDPGSIATGGEYTFGRGEFVTEFEDASYAMEAPGVVDYLVETDYGFHIIEVLELDIAPTAEEIASAQEYIDYATEYAKDYQYQEYFEEQYYLWLEDYTAEINYEVWEEVEVEVLPEDTIDDATTDDATTDETTTE